VPSNADYSFADIHEGMTVKERYVIDENVFQKFLSIFPDRSPVHADEAYARSNGFRGLVMHGAILNGFLSHFIGMRFPGRRSLELSVDMRYLKPSYLGDRLELEGTVTQKLESRSVVVMNVTYHNRTQGVTTARARVQVAIMSE
jgi:3-hydroxybutyryl-CoA dehydratase